MGLFEQLRDNIGRGLGALQGRKPQPAPMPQPEPAAAAAAMPDGPWGTAWLDEEDFLSTGIPYRPNEWFSLAQFRVPEDRQVQVAAGERRIRMYLKGLAVRAGQNLGAPANRNVVVPDLLQTKQAAPTCLRYSTPRWQSGPTCRGCGRSARSWPSTTPPAPSPLWSLRG